MEILKTMITDKFKSIKKVLLIMALFSLGLSSIACGKKENDIITDKTVVLTYGGENVSVGETYIYYETVKEKYQELYGENVWDISIATDGNPDATVSTLIKRAVIDEIVRVKILCSKAKEYGVELSEAEKKQITKRADKFYDGLTDACISQMELTPEIVSKVMLECIIADYVENEIFAKNPVEISDEEARMTKFYDLYFGCYKEKKDGSLVELSEEQKEKQYNNAVEACGLLASATIEDGEEEYLKASDIADLYKLDGDILFVYSPEEIKDIYGKEVFELLYSMKNGEHSTVVETKYGYHVFKMVALTDREATKNNKAQITKAKIDEVLNEKLTEWGSQIDKKFKYPDSVNMDAYDVIGN